MLNEIMAKITARERMIGIGAIVLAVAWIFGLIFATKNYCVTFAGQTACSGSQNGRTTKFQCNSRTAA